MTEQEMNAGELSPKTGLVPIGGPVVGPTTDRVLGGLIGGFLAYAVTHIPGHEIAMVEGQALAVGAAAGNLGTMLGALVPFEYRAWLQSVAMLAAALFGISAAA